jgi:hypothetical protein
VPSVEQVERVPVFALCGGVVRAELPAAMRVPGAAVVEVAEPEDFLLSSTRRRWRPDGPELGELASEYGRRFGADGFQISQSESLEEVGLRKKARLLVMCGLHGRRLDCMDNPHHRSYRPYRCGQRYCRFCGQRVFQKKFASLMSALTPVAESLLAEGARQGRVMVVAKMDFTIPNEGAMPTPEIIRRFHADLGCFWRAAERRFGIRGLYGVVRCDEFGGKKTVEHLLGNTNLHAHCVYVGPFLPQRNRELSDLWSEIRGERSFVSIKRARSFAGALAHALKYPSKFLDLSTPERLAQLEQAFHGSRRVSTGGRFYRAKEVRESGDDPLDGGCPHCGAYLCEPCGMHGWSAVGNLLREGREDIEKVRLEKRRAQIFAEGSGPPC